MNITTKIKQIKELARIVLSEKERKFAINYVCLEVDNWGIDVIVADPKTNQPVNVLSLSFPNTSFEDLLDKLRESLLSRIRVHVVDLEKKMEQRREEELKEVERLKNILTSFILPAST